MKMMYDEFEVEVVTAVGDHSWITVNDRHLVVKTENLRELPLRAGDRVRLLRRDFTGKVLAEDGGVVWVKWDDGCRMIYHARDMERA